MKLNFSLCLLVFFVAAASCNQSKTKDRVVYVDKPADNPPQQPPEPSPPPSPPQPPAASPFVDFDSFENDMLALLNSLNDQDRLNTRFISVCDQQNQGKPVGNYVKAIDKALNAVSSDRDITPTKSVANTECLRSFDLTDYGLNSRDWDSIVRNNPFRNTFESFTTRGIQIKFLTQERQPWMPGHVFAFTAFDANVYYDLLELPFDLFALQAQLGLDLQANFDNEDKDTYLFGHTGSPIAIGKPRMHLRTEIDDGSYYQSYDIVVANAGLAEKNIFQSPFPIEARSNNTLLPDGHEVIFSLPNGMHGYYLAAGNGLRQDFAPLDLVVDTAAAASALDPTIKLLACNRCHANGIIERQDEIFDKVRRDNTFNIEDVQKSEFWHGRTAEMAQQIRADNQRFSFALRQLGIQEGDTDWINFYTDKLRKESSAPQVAALMFLSPDEFEKRLDQTINSKNEIGSLIDGKTVSFEQLQQSLATFVVEANIFRNDFGE